MDIKEYLSTLNHCPFCKEKFFIEDWGTRDDFSKMLTCSRKHKDSSHIFDTTKWKKTLLIWCWANPELKITAVNFKLKNLTQQLYCQLCFDLKKMSTRIFSYDDSNDDIKSGAPIMSFDYLIDVPFDEEALRNKIKTYLLFK